MNLIANSMKYGGGSPIEVSVRSENGAGEIRVKDHGPGVSAADLPRIFDRFERAAPIGNYGGLGLGLYLVREIALAHGGSVSVERPDGGGACFVIRLPLDEPVPRCPAPPAP
jgi:signal transduction histidine kinase